MFFKDFACCFLFLTEALSELKKIPSNFWSSYMSTER